MFKYAKNLIKKSKCNIGVSITGIAGPGGGSKSKPVGLVWIGYGTIENNSANSYVFKGNRLDIRMHATLQSLINVNEFLKNNHL